MGMGSGGWGYKNIREVGILDFSCESLFLNFKYVADGGFLRT